jgi:hypothetical protein
MADTRLLFKEIPLNGRWRPADDPAVIGVSDFVEYTNLRPGPTNPEGIGGQTKINTAALATTGIKNGVHFRKDRPVESHVVVHTPSDGKVWKNDTAIPSAGAFNGTAVFTGSTGHGNGRFSIAPGGGLSFCNGVDSTFWGGDEYPAAAFIDYPDTNEIYDYTDQVTNTKTDADNVATIHTTLNAIDAATMLLLSFNTDLTDTSPTSPHTVTAVGNAAVSATQKKFGAKSCYFDGTGDYLTIPDNADFDFSGGAFTIDGWIYITSVGTSRTIYSHATDVNNGMRFYVTGNTPSAGLQLDVTAASTVVATVGCGSGIPINTWTHVAAVEDGDSWYLFINGILKASTTDTSRCANFTGVVNIGTDATSFASQFLGYIDELRVSNDHRWTSDFSVPNYPYGSTYVSTSYIGSIMPLDGVKLYVTTANTQTGTMEMYEWNGSTWGAGLTITDNTASAGKPLAQTGTVTWSTTATTSKTKFVEKRYLYWYKLIITSSADFTGTTLSRVNVSIPMQQIKDLWDGNNVTCLACIGNVNGLFSDNTMNVYRDAYDANDAGSYYSIASYKSTDYILLGFMDQVKGVKFTVVNEYQNEAAATTTIYYWGSTSSATAPAWIPLSSTDETLNGFATLNKSGVMYWDPPTKVQEFTQSNFIEHSEYVSSASTPMYYYKVVFSGTLTNDVKLSKIVGIPVQKTITGYVQPDIFQNRMALVCNKDGKKNSALLSSPNTVNVFGGVESEEFEFGDDKELVASKSLFTRYGSVSAEQWVLCKNNETWVVTGTGTDADPYVQRKITDYIGCTAPYTMTSVPIGMEDKLTGTLRTALIWQSSDGLYMFDGSSAPVKISKDIRHFFDERRTEYLTSAVLATCYGNYDPVYNAYVWIIPDSAEYQFSLEERKWYKVVRGTDKELNCIFPVQDTNGQYYNYGCSNSGFMYRLEYGTTFDGVAIAHTLQMSDAALMDGRLSQRVDVRNLRLIGKAKTTASTVAVSHYLDSSTTAGSPTITAISMQNTGKRLFNVFRSFGNVPCTCTFFSTKYVVSTSDETKGFEPMYVVIGYKSIGDDIR